MKTVIQKQKPVLITDVRYRMSLSIIRSLGKKGVHIIAADSKLTPKASSLGFFSKYTKECISLSDSELDKAAFISELIAYAVKANTPMVLIPVGIHSLMAISQNQDKLMPYYDMIVPSKELIDIANDTGTLLKIAEKAGVPVPMTTTLQENESIEALSQRLQYPVVVKYRQGELLKLGPEKRYAIVRNAPQLVEVFSRMHLLQEYPLVQEYIPGEGFGVSALFDTHGQPVQIFCHKRIREYPVTGGPSCFCQSIWDERLAEYAAALLKKLKWTGIAMVEFKGSLDGKLALMEINPRIWGSYPLTEAANSDFSYHLYQTAQGIDTGNAFELKPLYQEGKKLRFILQDLMSFKGYLKSRKNKLEFALSFMGDLLNPFVADGVFDLSDMKATIQYFRQAFKKAGGSR